jgi:hypothetical protein
LEHYKQETAQARGPNAKTFLCTLDISEWYMYKTKTNMLGYIVVETLTTTTVNTWIILCTTVDMKIHMYEKHTYLGFKLLNHDLPY